MIKYNGHLLINNRLLISLGIFLAVLFTQTTYGQTKNNEKSSYRSPYQIIDESPSSDWRPLDLKNTLYIQLASGTVVVELAPQFAPAHVSNIKALIKEHFFDNTNFYRVVDNFVAQGGPGENTEKKPLRAKLTIQGEMFFKTKSPLNITPLGEFDGYADETGFLNGFTLGRTQDKQKNWLLHCYGAVAMGRDNNINSGGTDFYIVIGQAQRYLDRNTTVFGRVITGMELLQKLDRSSDLQGPIDMTNKNQILSIKIADDLKPKEIIPIEVMKTDSSSFKALIESRKNRLESWFIYAHDYIDACSVSVPSRLIGNNNKSFK